MRTSGRIPVGVCALPGNDGGSLRTGGCVSEGVCTVPEGDTWDFAHWRGHSGGGLYSAGRPQCAKSLSNGVSSVQSHHRREPQVYNPPVRTGSPVHKAGPCALGSALTGFAQRHAALRHGSVRGFSAVISREPTHITCRRVSFAKEVPTVPPVGETMGTVPLCREVLFT